jgi:hypothetical protein
VEVGTETFPMLYSLIDGLGSWYLNSDTLKRCKDNKSIRLFNVHAHLFRWVCSCSQNPTIAVPLPRELCDLGEDVIKSQLRFLGLDRLWSHVLKHKLRVAGVNPEGDTQEYISKERTYCQDQQFFEAVTDNVYTHLCEHDFCIWDDFNYFASNLTSLHTEFRTKAENLFWLIFKSDIYSGKNSDCGSLRMKSILDFKQKLCIMFLDK